MFVALPGSNQRGKSKIKFFCTIWYFTIISKFKDHETIPIEMATFNRCWISLWTWVNDNQCILNFFTAFKSGVRNLGRRGRVAQHGRLCVTPLIASAIWLTLSWKKDAFSLVALRSYNNRWALMPNIDHLNLGEWRIGEMWAFIS